MIWKKNQYKMKMKENIAFFNVFEFIYKSKKIQNSKKSTSILECDLVIKFKNLNLIFFVLKNILLCFSLKITFLY